MAHNSLRFIVTRTEATHASSCHEVPQIFDVAALLEDSTYTFGRLVSGSLRGTGARALCQGELGREEAVVGGLRMHVG